MGIHGIVTTVKSSLGLNRARVRDINSMKDDDTTPSTDNPQTQWLTFTLGNETYGVDVLHITEVLRYTEIVPVPGAPTHVLGIMNLRDTFITVNDLRKILGLPSAEITDQTRIMIMEW